MFLIDTSDWNHPRTIIESVHKYISLSSNSKSSVVFLANWARISAALSSNRGIVELFKGATRDFEHNSLEA